VAALCGPSPRYKSALLGRAAADPSGITPLLLALLDEILRDPPGWIASHPDDEFGPRYALTLLAHLREPAAHERIVALGRQPPERFEALLDGFQTELFSEVLLATCGGRTAGMRALVADPVADEYVRGEAAAALVEAVGLGYGDRREVLALLAEQLAPERAKQTDHYFWTGVIDAMLKLHPTEHAGAILHAYDSGLVAPMTFDREELEAEIAAGPPELLPPPERDLHDWIGWWACFEEPEKNPAQRAAEREAERLAQKHKDAARRTRKAQRAARKAQRKRR
jgi:hypothetical protein